MPDGTGEELTTTGDSGVASLVDPHLVHLSCLTRRG